MRRGSFIWAVAFAATANAQEPPRSEESPGLDETVEELIVTAQRREQRAIEVPASLHVLPGDALAARGVRDVRDAFAAVPNLQFNMLGDGGGGTGIAIRGVSAAGVFGVDQAVAIYVDGVLMNAEGAWNPRLVDVDRVEVLRGPQEGTRRGGVDHLGAAESGTARRVRGGDSWLVRRVRREWRPERPTR